MKIIEPIKYDKKNSLKNLVFRIESMISQVVKGVYSQNWESEFVMLNILKNLEGMLDNAAIQAGGSSIQTGFSLYSTEEDEEEKGPLSTVAFLTNISFHDGQELEGIAYIDAFTKDKEKNTFSDLKKDHTRKLHSVSQHSKLLFLDYDMITGMAFPVLPEAVVDTYPNSWNNWTPYTGAALAPANVVMTLGAKNTGLYKVAVPFSYQLCYRYFYGIDYDHNKSALDVGKGLKTDKGLPKYLVLLSIAHGGSDLNLEFDFERDIYMKVE